jgi:hypothetical protein
MKTQYDYWKEDHDRVMAEMSAMQMKYYLHDTRENKYFKYGIQVNSMLHFHDVRRWFVDTYGLGADITRDEPIVNEHWAFYIIYQQYMIYLKGDEELNWFKLKYGTEAAHA